MNTTIHRGRAASLVASLGKWGQAATPSAKPMYRPVHRAHAASGSPSKWKLRAGIWWQTGCSNPRSKSACGHPPAANSAGANTNASQPRQTNSKPYAHGVCRLSRVTPQLA